MPLHLWISKAVKKYKLKTMKPELNKNKGESLIQSIESGNCLSETATGSVSTQSGIMGKNSAINHKEVSNKKYAFG